MLLIVIATKSRITISLTIHEFVFIQSRALRRARNDARHGLMAAQRLSQENRGRLSSFCLHQGAIS
jgi:hypothetical protein